MPSRDLEAGGRTNSRRPCQCSVHEHRHVRGPERLHDLAGPHLNPAKTQLRAYAMAVRANDFAFLDLCLQLRPGEATAPKTADICDLDATHMIEIHDERGKLPSAVRTWLRL